MALPAPEENPDPREQRGPKASGEALQAVQGVLIIQPLGMRERETGEGLGCAGLELHCKSLDRAGRGLGAAQRRQRDPQGGFAFSSTSQCWDLPGARVGNSRGTGSETPNLSCPGLLEVLSRSTHWVKTL